MESKPLDSRETLQITLAGHLAAHQLTAQSLAWLYASAPPSAVLWFHSWHPLPDLVAWFAAVGWTACAFMALALASVAARRRAEAGAAVAVGRAARLDFTATEELPRNSALLFGLSVIASAVPSLHGLMPRLVGAEGAAAGGTLWIVFVVGALLSRGLETL